MGLQNISKKAAPSAPEERPKPVDEDAENKIFMAGLPQFFTEEQVIDSYGGREGKEESRQTVLSTYYKSFSLFFEFSFVLYGHWINMNE